MRPHFTCPGCGRKLEKSAQAFVLGWAGVKPKEGDLPPAVTCPGCGFAIPTDKMIAGTYDEGPEWPLWLGVGLGLVAAFAAFYGPGYRPMASVGLGFAVLFAVVGLAAVVERLRR